MRHSGSFLFNLQLCGLILVFFTLVYLGFEEFFYNKYKWKALSVNWSPWPSSSELITHNNTTVLWQYVKPNYQIRIGFIIMTSSITRHLFLGQKRTWLRDETHVWAFSDEYDPLHFTYTLPSLYGKSSYKDAQHRQLRGMQWLIQKSNVDSLDWFFLIDDDTWVNLPVLYRFVSLLDHKIPMLCGHEFFKNKMFNGGAGILLSKPAFKAIAQRLYTDTCPFLGTNDDTITMCSYTISGLVRVHNAFLFAFYPDLIESPSDFIERITIHPVKDFELVKLMTTTTQALYDKNIPINLSIIKA